MLRKIRESLEKREEGFTLIELLVVVIIIGILAAIAIPVFLQQRKKAWDAAAKSDLRNAATAQESYYTDNSAYADDDNPTATSPLGAEGYNVSANIEFEVVSADATSYCMAAKHTSSDNWWYLGSATGAPSTAC